jgi:hypothetical protein
VRKRWCSVFAKEVGKGGGEKEAGKMVGLRPTKP